MSEGEHADSSLKWLTFFFVCFVLVQAIGAFAIFTYNANAPEPKPAGGGHHGMMVPEDAHAKLTQLA
ncbi:MAG: hypothetical protein K2X29_03655 [Candidatus Obscuribacterales bacterium]|nr:hypothetical protein [Candidatus Obscuribacterales bacterium]